MHASLVILQIAFRSPDPGSDADPVDIPGPRQFIDAATDAPARSRDRWPALLQIRLAPRGKEDHGLWFTGGSRPKVDALASRGIDDDALRRLTDPDCRGRR